MSNRADWSADHLLAERCASGDPQAQREFFDRYVDYVHGILYRILGSNRDIEDLVQDAFLEIFRSMDGFRGDALLKTWLSRITVRVAYAFLKRQRVASVPLEVVPADDGPAADAQVAARHALRRLYALLDELKPEQRVAFALHELDGRPIREVASMTSSNLIAVKSRVRRARARVRRDPIVLAFLREMDA